MASYNRNFRRGPGAAGAVGGIFGIGFGLLWTILAFVITADAPFPLVHVIFPLFGLLFICLGIAATVGGIASAAKVNEVGILNAGPMPPLPSRPVTNASATKHQSLVHCRECGEPHRVGGKFCTRCGTPVNGASI